MTQGSWTQPMEVLHDFRMFTEMKIAAGIEPGELFDSPTEVRHIDEILKDLELVLDQMALDPKGEADWELCFDEVTAYRAWFTPLVQRTGLLNSIN